MKDYDVLFNYRSTGQAIKTFSVRVTAYNKGEALVRAGAAFRAAHGGLPDHVDGIIATPRSKHGFR